MRESYAVILKNLKDEKQVIVLADGYANRAVAEGFRKNWRKILGNKHWTVDRRPGLDTLDHLGLKVVKVVTDA